MNKKTLINCAYGVQVNLRNATLLGEALVPDLRMQHFGGNFALKMSIRSSLNCRILEVPLSEVYLYTKKWPTNNSTKLDIYRYTCRLDLSQQRGVKINHIFKYGKSLESLQIFLKFE